MKQLDKLFNQDAFSLLPIEKKSFFLNYINNLNVYHYKKSILYKRYLNKLNIIPNKNSSLVSVPFLPVRLFKEFDFLSVDKKNIFKVLQSSGTTSNMTSKIYIDKTNAYNQIKVLQKIFNTVVGNSRLPMLVIGSKNNKLNRNNFNASAAAISGFSMFANEVVYLLDQSGNIDYKNLNIFLNKHNKSKFLIFGFTHNIFLNLINKLKISNLNKTNLSEAFLIHGGGWKKIEKQKIKRETFNKLLEKKFNIKKIINYYGLVEQIGSIFFECKCGYFIASNFSEIIIRDENLKECSYGKKGFVQLLSLLPTSYPGHSILTEDIGEIVEDKNCNCYGHGTRFLIHGRLKNAELRGCSNI
jgi:phenylacetate-coenzyme A ligase PaaK-like adenylate-forming protein